MLGTDPATGEQCVSSPEPPTGRQAPIFERNDKVENCAGVISAQNSLFSKAKGGQKAK